MTVSRKYPYEKKQSIYRTVFLAAIFFLLLFFPARSFAIADPDPEPPYDEILVFMNVQGVGSVQVPAAIHNEIAWLSITDVFDYLKIRNIPSPGMDSISGYFIFPQATYIIDRINHRIEYQGKKNELHADGILRISNSLYLRADYFGQVFGLQCKFSFRSLSVILSTDIELPVIKEIRQQAMHNNLGRLKGEIKADTTILRSYPLFKIGMVDWAIVNTQDVQQWKRDTRMNLTLGGVVAGGETNISLNYHNNTPFSERQQFYQWRLVDNDNPALKQVMAGKIFTPSIASIFSPVVGVQFTNAPSIYRRSFGTYTLTYFTEAGWVAELYVNNTLVDYAKADATGMSAFQVPLVYGNSQVKIRFYSPWGEERISEQNIVIPFNFLPKHEFEYMASAGVVEDSLNSKFSKVKFNYGLSGRLTIGGGMEYLSSVITGKAMPFLEASMRLSPNLLVSGEYTYGVRSKFVGSYHLPSDLQIEVNYIRYKKGQKAINNTFTEERKAIVSFPFRRRKFALFSRLSVYQVILPNTKYSTVEGLLSGILFGINTNFTNYALFAKESSPYMYGNLSTAFRLPGKIILTTQGQFEYNYHKLISVKAELGKYLNARGYVNAFYENNFKSGFSSFGLGLRYDFSFAMSGFSFNKTNQGTNVLVQTASGSVLYDRETSYTSFNNRSSVGRGAITVIPYLDLNGNGRRDMDDPKVFGVHININGGNIKYYKKDTLIRVTNLEAYASYTLKITEAFENVAWHIRNKTISIIIDPNQYKVIEVPVAVAGEVAGIVYLNEEDSLITLSRILVSFYRRDFTLAGETMTEADGTFNFSGLPPGSYTAQINTAQLEKLHMKSLPWNLAFTISIDKNGDFVDGLQFILQKVSRAPAKN